MPAKTTQNFKSRNIIFCGRTRIATYIHFPSFATLLYSMKYFFPSFLELLWNYTLIFSQIRHFRNNPLSVVQKAGLSFGTLDMSVRIVKSRFFFIYTITKYIKVVPKKRLSTILVDRCFSASKCLYGTLDIGASKSAEQ